MHYSKWSRVRVPVQDLHECNGNEINHIIDEATPKSTKRQTGSLQNLEESKLSKNGIFICELLLKSVRYLHASGELRLYI